MVFYNKIRAVANCLRSKGGFLSFDLYVCGRRDLPPKAGSCGISHTALSADTHRAEALPSTSLQVLDRGLNVAFGRANKVSFAGEKPGIRQTARIVGLSPAPASAEYESGCESFPKTTEPGSCSEQKLTRKQGFCQQVLRILAAFFDKSRSYHVSGRDNRSRRQRKRRQVFASARGRQLMFDRCSPALGVHFGSGLFVFICVQNRL